MSRKPIQAHYVSTIEIALKHSYAKTCKDYYVEFYVTSMNICKCNISMELMLATADMYDRYERIECPDSQTALTM